MELFVIKLSVEDDFMFVLRGGDLELDVCYADIAARYEVQEQPYAWVDEYHETVTLVGLNAFNGVKWVDEQCNIKGSTSTIDESYVIFMLGGKEVMKGRWVAGHEDVQCIDRITVI